MQGRYDGMTQCYWGRDSGLKISRRQHECFVRAVLVPLFIGSQCPFHCLHRARKSIVRVLQELIVRFDRVQNIFVTCVLVTVNAMITVIEICILQRRYETWEVCECRLQRIRWRADLVKMGYQGLQFRWHFTKAGRAAQIWVVVFRPVACNPYCFGNVFAKRRYCWQQEKHVTPLPQPSGHCRRLLLALVYRVRNRYRNTDSQNAANRLNPSGTFLCSAGVYLYRLGEDRPRCQSTIAEGHCHQSNRIAIHEIPFTSHKRYQAGMVSVVCHQWG